MLICCILFVENLSIILLFNLQQFITEFEVTHDQLLESVISLCFVNNFMVYFSNTRNGIALQINETTNICHNLYEISLILH